MKNRILLSLLSYDDFEDRALTTFCVQNWKTIYISTAIVYTYVPDNFKKFKRQQQRWKKDILRATIFASIFFWRKNPIICISFYFSFLLTIVSPVVIITALLYGMFILNEVFMPLSLVRGFVIVGVLEGIDYNMRDSESKFWMYKPLRNLILAFFISWLVFHAIFNYKKNVWLTR